MEVVSGIMRIVVPIPPTHPRRSTSILPVRDIEIAVRVDTDLKYNLLNCVRKVLKIKPCYDRFRTLVRKDSDRFNE